MNTSELKLKLFKQIDALETNKLQEIYGIMMNFLNSGKGDDNWSSLSEYEKEGIESAIREIDEGYGLEHKAIIDKYKKKYSDTYLR